MYKEKYVYNGLFFIVLLFNGPNFLLCMMAGYSRAEAQDRRALCWVLRVFSKVMGLELDEARQSKEAMEI
jgi:hypothetical protein